MSASGGSLGLFYRQPRGAPLLLLSHGETRPRAGRENRGAWRREGKGGGWRDRRRLAPAWRSQPLSLGEAGAEAARGGRKGSGQRRRPSLGRGKYVSRWSKGCWTVRARVSFSRPFQGALGSGRARGRPAVAWPGLACRAGSTNKTRGEEAGWSGLRRFLGPFFGIT